MLVWRRQLHRYLSSPTCSLSKLIYEPYLGTIAGSVSFVALQCELFLVVLGVAVYYEQFLAVVLFVSVQYRLFLAVSFCCCVV